jgi:hypothetical protein
MSQDITQDILSQAVKDVMAKFGKMNLAELERMQHLSSQQLRHLQKNDFKLMPNGTTGKSKTTKISPSRNSSIPNTLPKGSRIRLLSLMHYEGKATKQPNFGEGLHQ